MFITLFSSINSFADWKCQFSNDDKSLPKNIIYKVTDKRFLLSEFYGFSDDPKAIEYKIDCSLNDQTCSGEKIITAAGQKKNTKFTESITSKGNELKEFNQIRYFIYLSNKKIKLRATHKNKIVSECSNENR